MPKSKAHHSKTPGFFDIQEYLSTAPCVPALRNAVSAWRSENYKGASETTRELLYHWFKTDHRLPNGQRFAYHLAQREAIETLVYLYEVEKVRSRKSLLEHYAFDSKNLRLPPYDDFGRYCIKMATGSGKTKVMALAVVWQYFNAVRENSADCAKTFLVIAPNVIVFECLRTDFQNGHVFRADPMIPKHLIMFWDFESYVRGDAERAHSEGALFLTNIQQFYERPSRARTEEPEVLTSLLGQKPQAQKLELTDFDQRIAKRDGLLMVLNDEAHHTHEEDNEWNRVIRKIHSLRPIAAQLDFSATPRYSKGGLFAWTIFDYPLKQAIIDGIVKRPIKGISKIEEAKSTVASTRYKGFLVAGVERWKEYRDQLQLLKKKPILFVMMNNTDEADEVGDWLRSQYHSDFAADRTLIIHTDKAGEVSKKDLDAARKLAREVDEKASRVKAIVSVLMLREGWDVQNVTVVVGLRPYAAKANILRECNSSAHRREARQHLMNHCHSRPDLSGRSGIQYGRSLDSRLSTKKMADAQNTKAAGMTASVIFQKQNAEQLRYNYQKALLEFSQELPRLMNLDAILNSLVSRISSTMHVEKVAAIICDEREECYTVSKNIADECCQFELKGDGLMALLETTKRAQSVAFLEEESVKRISNERDRRMIQDSGIVLAIPMILQDRLIGSVNVGPKLSGKVYSQEDFDLLMTVASQAAIAIENVRLHRSEIERQRIQEELALARRIQQGLLPKANPVIKGLDVSGVSLPALTVGGDYFDFIEIDEERLLVVVADVSGKGMSAALYMSKIQGMIQSVSRLYESPKDTLKHVNRYIYDGIDRKSFITVIAALFDMRKREARICRVGHNKALISINGQLKFLEGSGMGPGLERGTKFDDHLEETVIQFEREGLFVFYSDGLPETMDAERRQLGEEALFDLVRSKRHLTAFDLQRTILTTVEEFQGAADQHDDLTLVVVKS